ncbi:HlyD family efflux transporter periplasmic adaptor subunit [uncultured Nitrosomonas sp.]|uniref:efflux RND transporter periplasmic adaptor subunit n=1 Tax=uncultured Nitrosomonas sp. TaxID=156424 RepID=UPI0025D1F059|nr:HlyD family efflux transporter periplasmic adaptor subunit [uncultured Nitrosomonas sp.]
MVDKPQGESNQTLSTLLQLESDARSSVDSLSLHYFIVNETRRLIHYRYAVLFKASGSKNRNFEAIRASGSNLIDRTTPKIHWMAQVIHYLSERNNKEKLVKVVPEQLSAELQQDWKDLSLPYSVWVSLRLPCGSVIGSLWLEREVAWNDDELFLLKRLADTYAHAWGYFDNLQQRFKSWFLSQKILWGIMLFLILALLVIPVQNSTLGPVKIVAKDPLVISAPIDGVIASISVEPNEMVTRGQLLLSYEDTNYRNEYAITEQSLVVAQAELKKATQGAFEDPRNNAEIALLKAKVDLAIIKRNFAKEMLDHVNIIAEKDGLLLFNDKAELIGRPISTGERLMEVAEIDKVMLLIYLPVENNIDFRPGAPVKVFLDVNPLHSIDAIVTYASYRAEITPGEILAYRVEAATIEELSNLRIGWQGTAKIYGENVSLFFYLFKRPLSSVRQYLGF